jgi:transcriptional regulator with XRE-family HTH domain
MKASREMASRPLWVFDSPLLRQALAQVNVPAILRAASGLSQRDLAAIVGWSGAALSYYERGQRDAVYDIRAVLQLADAVGMPRAALLPMIFADPDASLAAGSEDRASTDVNRRGFGGLATAAAEAAVSIPRGAGSSHIRYWRACTDTLYVRDRAVGGTVLLQSALQQWQHVRQALNEPGDNGELSRQLLATASDLALCTGWIALDGGHLPLARSLYVEARHLAAGAGDTLLAVHTLTNLSMLHTEIARTGPSREHARQALQLAFQAADEGRYIPEPELHALINRARRELNRGPRDGDPPEWLRFVGDPEITGVEASGYLTLGEASQSALLYHQVLAAGLSARNRASYGAGLADALLKQGARREAVAAAMEVLPALEGSVVRQAAGNTAGAQEFCDRFDAAERALASLGNLPGADAREARSDIPA